MKESYTTTEKIVSIILLLIGVLFTYQAIIGFINGYIIHYNDPHPYRICLTTIASNLINGNLLIASSLFFLKKKSLGAFLYQYTGIMFILYAINLNLFDMLLYNDFDGLIILISIAILLPFGIFLYFYFRKRNTVYKNRFILPVFILLGIITYSYINLFFFDWHMYMEIK